MGSGRDGREEKGTHREERRRLVEHPRAPADDGDAAARRNLRAERLALAAVDHHEVEVGGDERIDERINVQPHDAALLVGEAESELARVPVLRVGVADEEEVARPVLLERVP